MPRANKLYRALLFVPLIAGLLLGACSVSQHKSGDKEDVKINTPVGGMHVTTDADVKEVGMSVYPGAKLKPGDEHDKNSANVNINTPFFGLKVVAQTFLSDDSPEKITEYYKKELAKYGSVVQCRGRSHGTTYKRGEGSQPVSCDNEDHAGDALELKVGTNENQHVVAIKSSGKGTEFSLVYVNARGGKGEAL